jgi:hypothetical protein
MGHHSLWQCGASYLECCSDQGLTRLEALLQTIPLGTEARVHKIINVAKENNLHRVGKLRESFIKKIQYKNTYSWK